MDKKTDWGGEKMSLRSICNDCCRVVCNRGRVLGPGSACGYFIAIKGQSATSHSQVENGKKYDSGKMRLDLLPPAALLAIGSIMTYGADKYGANNWQGVEIERYEAALLRHLLAWKQGEKNDRESGLPHLHHMLTNAAFIVALEEEKNGLSEA